VLIVSNENRSCEIEAVVRGYQSVWAAGIGENLACVSDKGPFGSGRFFLRAKYFSKAISISLPLLTYCFKEVLSWLNRLIMSNS